LLSGLFIQRVVCCAYSKKISWTESWYSLPTGLLSSDLFAEMHLARRFFQPRDGILGKHLTYFLCWHLSTLRLWVSPKFTHPPLLDRLRAWFEAHLSPHLRTPNPGFNYKCGWWTPG
jgi:hypothetical protein